MKKISVTMSCITSVLERNSVCVEVLKKLDGLQSSTAPFYLLIFLHQIDCLTTSEIASLKNTFKEAGEKSNLLGILFMVSPDQIERKNDILIDCGIQLGEVVLETRHPHYSCLLMRCITAHQIHKNNDDLDLIMNADEATEILYNKSNKNYEPLYNTDSEQTICLFNSEKNIILCSSLNFIYPEVIGKEDNLAIFIDLIFRLFGKKLNRNLKSTIKKTLFELHPDSYKTAPIKLDTRENYYKTLSVNFDQEESFQNYYDLPNPYEDFETFLMKAQLFSDKWPEDIKNCIREFKRNSNYYGGLLLRNLPKDQELCPTPYESIEITPKKTFVSEFLLCAVSNFLGDPFTYYQERKRNLFHNICPSFKNKDKISSESSEINLDFHSEIIFHPFSPDYLLLYCLRQDPAGIAKTSILSIDQLLPHIPMGYLSLFFEERFITGIDYSFGSKNGLKGNGLKRSVLYGDPENPFFRCDFDLMVGADHEAQKALDFLQELSKTTQTSVMLKEGDLFIIDNHKAMHARSAFQANYDGRDRWLQRLLISSNLNHIKHNLVFKDRVVDVNFAI